MMKQGSTMLLRLAIIIMGVGVLAVCARLLPVLINSFRADEEYQPILLGIYFTAVPFFVALYQVLKLLRFVDKNQAFSGGSVRALAVIKYCALAVGGAYTVGLPYLYVVAQQEDAPGVLAIGLVLTFASLTITVFAAVLQRLVQSAISLKAENDLTV